MSRSRSHREALLVAVLVLATAALGWPRAALADDRLTLSGSWSASALTEQWAIGDWGAACGPRPTAQGAGGGAVQIKEQGNELSIAGAGRAFTTAECWEQMPGLARTSHSASGNGRFWRTRCSTGANDSRRATVVTSLSATDTTLVLNETGQYQFVLEGQNCTASVTRSRSFSLGHREGDAPPVASAAPSASAPPPAPVASGAPAPAPEPRPPARCAGPAGDPARLEVYPGRKLMRPGDTFAFRAVVRDADGCPTASRPTWTIGAGPLAGKASVDGTGAVTIALGAGEGRVDLVAAVAGRGVTIGIEVASADRYDALLAASGGDAGDGAEAAVAVIATGTIGGRLAVAQDTGHERKLLFVAIVGLVALALGFAGLVLVRRGRRPLDLSSEPGDANASANDRQDDGDGDGGSNGQPGPVARVPVAPPARPPEARSPAHRLAPAAARSAPKGMICPTCGERFEAGATFCGKDATQLMPLN